MTRSNESCRRVLSIGSVHVVVVVEQSSCLESIEHLLTRRIKITKVMLLNSVAKHSFVDAILKNGVTLLIGKEEIRDYSPRHEESFYKIPPKRIELYLS